MTSSTKIVLAIVGAALVGGVVAVAGNAKGAASGGKPPNPGAKAPGLAPAPAK